MEGYSVEYSQYNLHECDNIRVYCSINEGRGEAYNHDFFILNPLRYDGRQDHVIPGQGEDRTMKWTWNSLKLNIFEDADNEEEEVHVLTPGMNAHVSDAELTCGIEFVFTPLSRQREVQDMIDIDYACGDRRETLTWRESTGSFETFDVIDMKEESFFMKDHTFHFVERYDDDRDDEDGDIRAQRTFITLLYRFQLIQNGDAPPSPVR